eukprot:c21598_g1_i1.p1 GENE.c21598_g1_i1~~c21598_g1_i1.p1  ORF type:complete len:616 (+),score=178.92 c21598_g1_i1:1-1848(+)
MGAPFFAFFLFCLFQPMELVQTNFKKVGSIVKQDDVELSIDFQGLHLEVNDNTGVTKTILHSVDGKAEAGKVLALMGSTGSGKTTLLSILSGRLSQTKGRVTYGSYGWSKSLKRRIGFVEQDDVVLSALTVRESLQYSARLRLPSTISYQSKMDRVEEVIKMLRLEKCSNTIIGNSLERGISGGERKRLCIGTELLARPSILFLDEPTTGLDSTNALMVISCIKDLARSNKVTVISSIHQPNSQIYELFDDLILLHEGYLMYGGPAQQATQYFSKHGHDCPPNFNPPDFLVDLLVLGKLDKQAIEKISNENRRINVQDKLNDNSESPLFQETTSERYNTTYFDQVTVLAERMIRCSKGGVFDTNSILLYGGLAFLTGFLWLRIDNKEDTIYLRAAISLWFVATWMFFPTFASLFLYSSERVMLQKELRSGSFRLSAWFIAKSVTHYFVSLIWPVIWCPIVYYMTGINDSFVSFILSFFVIVLTVALFDSLGWWVGVIVPGHRGPTVMELVDTFCFAFAGLLNPNLWEWVTYLRYITLLMYPYEIFLVTAFYEITFVCNSNASEYEVCRKGGQTISGSDVINKYVTVPTWVSVLVTLVSIVILRVWTYRSLRKQLL